MTLQTILCERRITYCVQASFMMTEGCMLYHAATHCNNTLQHTAVHCSTLQYTAAHCSTMQHTAAPCSTHFSTLQHPVCCFFLAPLVAAFHHFTMHCNNHTDTMQQLQCHTLQHNTLQRTSARLFTATLVVACHHRTELVVFVCI